MPFLLALDGTSAEFATRGPDLTRYLLVCAGLVLGVVLCGVLAKRFLAGNLRARASRRSMAVVDVLPLSGRQRMAVVRCYDRTFLMGMGEKELCLVAELDAEEVTSAVPESAVLPEAAGAAAGQRPDFASLLGKARPSWARGRTRESQPASLGDGAGLLG